MSVEPLPFNDRDGESYERTQNNGVVVRPLGEFRYIVRLTDGENPHDVRMAYDSGQLVGSCDCDGWRYQDSACAHLWAVFGAAEMNVIELTNLRDVLSTDVDRCPACGREVVDHGH